MLLERGSNALWKNKPGSTPFHLRWQEYRPRWIWRAKQPGPNSERSSKASFVWPKPSHSKDGKGKSVLDGPRAVGYEICLLEIGRNPLKRLRGTKVADSSWVYSNANCLRRRILYDAMHDLRTAFGVGVEVNLRGDDERLGSSIVIGKERSYQLRFMPRVARD